jgi:hypothetical protein
MTTAAGDGTMDGPVSTSLTVLDVTVRAAAVVMLSLAVVALVGARRARATRRPLVVTVADVRVDASRTAVVTRGTRDPRAAARAIGLLGALAVGAGLAGGLGVAIVLARLAGALAGLGAR